MSKPLLRGVKEIVVSFDMLHSRSQCARETLRRLSSKKLKTPDMTVRSDIRPGQHPTITVMFSDNDIDPRLNSSRSILWRKTVRCSSMLSSTTSMRFSKRFRMRLPVSKTGRKRSCFDPRLRSRICCDYATLSNLHTEMVIHILIISLRGDQRTCTRPRFTENAAAWVIIVPSLGQQAIGTSAIKVDWHYLLNPY